MSTLIYAPIYYDAEPYENVDFIQLERIYAGLRTHGVNENVNVSNDNGSKERNKIARNSRR